MKIKRYFEFSEYGIKQELLSYFDRSRPDIESKGMDFQSIRSSLQDSLDRLDDGFIKSITERLSSLPKEEEDFKRGFEEIMEDISSELSSANESFVGDIFSAIKSKAKRMAKWISDRIFTISGATTLGLGAILFAISNFGSGFGIPKEFENAAINSILVLGATAFAYGQKNDEYKQKSEI